MRRRLAILLLAAFGLPAVAPLLAQGQDSEINLPACCRRGGTHHCMGAPMRDANTPTASARCRSFPQPSAIAPHLKLSARPSAQPAIKLPLAIQAIVARAETQRRISRERSRHKRGPPAALLAA
jgi:hypothetical protein